MQQGMMLHQQGRLAEAAAAYASVLAQDPRHADALHLSGVIKLQQGKPAEALELIDRGLRLKPQALDIMSNLAVAQVGSRRFSDALATYNKLLAASANANPELWQAHGFVLANLGRHEEALESFDRALKLAPGHPAALFNRANTLAALQRHDEALNGYEQVLKRDPRNLDALNNRGNVLSQLGRFAEALASYEQVLARKPDHLDALSNRGNVLRELHRLDEATASYDRALALAPNHISALYNKSGVLIRLKRYDAAIENLKKLAALALDDTQIANLLGISQLATCAWDDAASTFARLRKDAHAGEQVEPFTFLAFGAKPEDQLICAKSYLKNKLPAVTQRPHQPRQSRPERLRVAYLSSDFRQHPVAHAIVEVLEQHDRADIEIIGLSSGADDGTPIRARIKAACDQFHDIRGRSDADVAAFLRQSQIDILVDLNGHTDGARPGILAQRGVPVQVNYLGFAGTGGADFWDYIIADAAALPFDQQPHYAEKIVHLPDSFFPRDSHQPIADAITTRREAGLPDGAMVFCCFNNSYKITAPVFQLWIRLMTKVRDSVLWLSEANVLAKDTLRQAAATQGVDPDRIIFAPRLEQQAAHLGRHRFADLFLDTLPFNAHATASDALWAGLPVLTCKGETFAGRVGASLLHAAGLPELVTDSLALYEEKAVRLAEDRTLLQSLRDKLRESRDRAPLFDARRLSRHLERAYREMDDIGRRGEEARGFVVSPVS